MHVVPHHLLTVAFACATFAGCAGAPPSEVRPDAPVLPPAAIERVPTAVGVHFPTAVRDAQPVSSFTAGGIDFAYRHAIGDAIVATARQALAAVYEQVVELPDWKTSEAIPPGLAAVVVPSAPVVSTYLAPSGIVSGYRRNVNFTLTFHSPDGEADMLNVTGVAATGVHGPVFAFQKILDQQVLRNAGAAMVAALDKRAAAGASRRPHAEETFRAARGVLALRLDAGFARDDGIERRVTACLASVVPPPASLASEQPAAALRDALFPWLDPWVAPQNADDIRTLLGRPPVRARLAALGVGTLVLFTARDVAGGKTEAFGCVGALGAAGCFGLYEARNGYAVDLAVWDVAASKAVDTSRAEVMIAIGAVGVIFPIPFYYSTAAEACAQMQAFVRKVVAAP